MFKNWGLKKQFATVFIVLITLPTMLFGCIIYFQTTNTFKQQVEDNTMDRIEVNEQTLQSIIYSIENISSFMIYDDNFRSFFTMSAEERKHADYSQIVKGIKGYFTFQLMSFDYIDSITLKAKDGDTLEFGNTILGTEKWLEEEAAAKKGAIHWSNSYSVSTSWSRVKNVSSLKRVINDINQINEPIGMVTIRLDSTKLFKMIEKKFNAQPGTYFVISNTGDVILHENPSLVGKPYPNREIVQFSNETRKRVIHYNEDGVTYLGVKKKIEGTDWYAAVVVNQSKVADGLYSIRSLFLLSFIVLIMLGIIAFIGFYFSNIKRITELTQQTRLLESQNFNARVQVSSQDEIGILGMRFNHLAISIQQYINREYKLKIKQKESELKALQSQIDPHFLYNTLDMIRWTARLENAMETGQLIERLSKNFRMNLSMGKMWVQIEEELMFVQNYLELQKSRMGRRLHYSIYYDDNVKGFYIIKQLLQPLVENSIQHGFKNLRGQGKIQIRCYQNDDEIWVDVIDNGDGFPRNLTENETGFALKNLTERLNLLFGRGFGMERLDSEIGTWIRLKIPIVIVDHEKNLGDVNDL
ncbi:histidine kinase [Peribacillus psychrosaccharolyticus]|uniref:cache domain-containing sensor histidine kinase n=1 Tax=Peribacillus psychrosaccharolyticus TaxID=1407 RepID=UPI003D294BF7